jgi:COMPASS component SDC1
MSQPNTPELTAQEQVPASISAAAHAYQLAMQQQSATPPAVITPAPQVQAPDSTKDVVMTDGTPDRPAVSFKLLFLTRSSTE